MVSAIITTYKRAPEIVERAILSVLYQTYGDIEIIVVDDSPRDYKLRSAVRETVKKYENRNVKYIEHEKNSGACVARNTGIANSSGEYVGFLDDDDEWLPTKIEKQISVFKESDDNTAIVYCGKYVVNEITKETYEYTTSFYEGYLFEKLLEENFIGSTSFPLIKRTALEEIGGFNPDMPASQDYDVWLKISQKYSVRYVDEPLVNYHIHEGDFISKDPTKKIIAIEKINDMYCDYFSNNKKIVWKRNMELVESYAAKKSYFISLRILFRMISISPSKVMKSVRFFLRGIKRSLQ